MLPLEAIAPAAFILAFVGMIALAGWAIWHHHRQERLRSEGYAAEALRMGLAYSLGPDKELPKGMTGLVPVQRASSAKPAAIHILHGQRGVRSVWFFELTYVVSTGKSSTTVYVPMAVVKLPEPWPRLSAVPENLGHKLWDAMGGEDINFESDEFSKKFWVQSDDRKFAYDVFHPRAMEHLLAHPWVRLSVAGGYACVWSAYRAPPEFAARMLEVLNTFVDLVPRFARPAKKRHAVVRPPPKKLRVPKVPTFRQH